MKFVTRENIDIQKWDELVKRSANNSVFSLSSYLDAVSENWCVFVDEKYSKGIALPYSVRMGIKMCYTPIFVRYLEWLGAEKIKPEELSKLIQNEFLIGQLSSNVEFVTHKEGDLIFQEIHSNNSLQLNSQAKRMLTKFEKSGLKIEQSIDEKIILKRIKEELPKKISSINDHSLLRLEKLVNSLKKKDMLQSLVVKDHENIVGGLFLVRFNNSLLYLKGAFTPESKKEGAMYSAMLSAIELGKKDNLLFDFGGSRVDGVRRFNLNLGGIDRDYYSLEWDNSPLWFKLIKKAKKAWKRK